MPNIIGRFAAVSDTYAPTGVFTSGGGTGANFNAGTFGYPIDRYYNFNASNSNTTYGNTTAVTPLSLSVLHVVKY